MDKKQEQTVCDYINHHAASLHGLTGDQVKHLDVGPPITPDNIIGSRVSDGEIVVLVDRGVKGTPKYTLEAKAVNAFKPATEEAPPKAATKGSSSKK